MCSFSISYLFYPNNSFWSWLYRITEAGPRLSSDIMAGKGFVHQDPLGLIWYSNHFTTRSLITTVSKLNNELPFNRVSLKKAPSTGNMSWWTGNLPTTGLILWEKTFWLLALSIPDKTACRPIDSPTEISEEKHDLWPFLWPKRNPKQESCFPPLRNGCSVPSPPSCLPKLEWNRKWDRSYGQITIRRKCCSLLLADDNSQHTKKWIGKQLAAAAATGWDTEGFLLLWFPTEIHRIME